MMKRILCWLLVMMLSLGCVCAEEIGEMKTETQDPNEISEQGAPAQQKEQYETAGLDWVTESAPAPATEPIENPAIAITGTVVEMGSVKLQIPEGWTVAADSQEEGTRTISASKDMLQLQIQSQSIGTAEEVEASVQVMGKEGLLESIVGGTMNGFGITEFEHTFTEQNGICCMTVNTDITMGEMPCGMGLAVMLEGGVMTLAMVMSIFGTAADTAPVLAAVLAPMMQ